MTTLTTTQTISAVSTTVTPRSTTVHHSSGVPPTSIVDNLSQGTSICMYIDMIIYCTHTSCFYHRSS